MNAPDSGPSATTVDAVAPARRQRGPNDPNRRARIARAAVAVIAEHGLDSLTHRKVAAAAGVPLGSTTYHFRSLDDLIAAALDDAAEAGVALMRKWADSLEDDADLSVSLADFVIESVGERRGQTLAEYNLYVLALHRPQLQPAVAAWDSALSDVLVSLTDDVTGRMLGTLLCGVLMQAVLRGDRPSRPDLEVLFRRAIDAEVSAAG